MSAATNALEDALLTLLFINTDAANIGDATGLRGSSTAGVFWVSLHTGSPGETGTQTTSETAYSDYARKSVARSAAGWTVTTGTCDNDAAITFPASTGAGDSVTHFGIGSSETSTGNLWIYGATGGTLVTNSGVTPEFAAGALDISLA